MKLLFLDIDGVLNHQEFYCRVYEDENGDIDKVKMQQWRDENPYPLCEFDPIAVKRVVDVLNETGAKLVVSSSWRIGDNGSLKNIFAKVGLPTEFEFTPNLMYNFSSLKMEDVCRGDEIKKYMEDKDVDAYVILDDDEDMLNEQQNSFIHCDFMVGFTENDKKRAIEILGKK